MKEFFIYNIPSGEVGGIYEIRNINNNKVYVGKTVNFKRRYNTYKSAYKTKRASHINGYLMSAIDKHGANSFRFTMIEACSVEEMSERELFWMVEMGSTDPLKGYNLRMDSSTGMITHQSTRDKISKRVRSEYASGVRSPSTTSDFFREYWKDGDLKASMSQSVSESSRSYFIQKNREGEVVCVWNGINQIRNHYPSWKWQNIYAACNGSKKSYMNFLWERVRYGGEIPVGEMMIGKEELCEDKINKVVDTPSHTS